MTEAVLTRETEAKPGGLTTRVLPPDQWPRLVGTELEAAWPYLPEGAQVVVVEQGDQIVGCAAVIPYLHLEGLWIASAHRRKAGVGRRLLRGLFGAARQLRARHVLSMGATPEMHAILTKLGGQRVPCPFYELPVGE